MVQISVTTAVGCQGYSHSVSTINKTAAADINSLYAMLQPSIMVIKLSNPEVDIIERAIQDIISINGGKLLSYRFSYKDS